MEHWIVFILLTFIGVKMIHDAKKKEEQNDKLDIKTMLALATATSIDALAVGITFVAVPVKVINSGGIQNVLLAVTIIAVITCIISMLGVKIGHLFGMRYKSGSEILGGSILIIIGLKALIGFFI